MLVTGLRTLPATAVAVAAVAAVDDMPSPPAPQVAMPPQSAQAPPPPQAPQQSPASNHTDDPRIVAEPHSEDSARHIDSKSSVGGGDGGSNGGGGGDGGSGQKEKSPSRITPVADGSGLREAPTVEGVAGAVSSVGGKGSRLIALVNCHLTGGPAPERRMRQVLDGLDAARKEAARFLSAEIAAAATAAAEGGKGKGNKKGKKGGGGGGGGAAKPTGTSVPVVVCGDFNSNGRTAVWELLTQGVVEASYRERGYPEVSP